MEVNWQRSVAKSPYSNQLSGVAAHTFPLPSPITNLAIIRAGQPHQRLDGLQKRGPKTPRAQLSIPRPPDDPRLHHYDWPVESPSSCALHLTLRSRIMLAAPDRFDRVRDENRRRDYPRQFAASSREGQSTRTRRMVEAELVLLFL
jgi:hypothetical protein